MKKFVMLITMMIASTAAYAGSKVYNNEQNNSMISVEEATGVWRTNRFIYDKDMNLIFCQENSQYDTFEKKCTKNGENGWRRLENTAPPGKKVIGFKSISVRDVHYIEIYWK
jgi:hypothetical protein